MATSRPTPREASAPSPEQPLTQLISKTTADLGSLVRKEIELAKIEIKEDVRHTAKAGGAFGAAGFAGYMAAVLVSLAIVFVLDIVMPLWVAFLIVAVVYAIGGVVLFRQARIRMRSFTPGPEQTVETLKEDMEWAKARAK